MHASESLHTAGICAWLITSDAICRKNVAVYRITGYLVRNAKLIHEQRGSSRSTLNGLARGVVVDPADE